MLLQMRLQKQPLTWPSRTRSAEAKLIFGLPGTGMGEQSKMAIPKLHSTSLGCMKRGKGQNQTPENHSCCTRRVQREVTRGPNAIWRYATRKVWAPQKTFAKVSGGSEKLPIKVTRNLNTT